jgi:hypothetical protein
MQPSDPQGQPPAGENQPPAYGQASSPGYGAQPGYPYSSPPSPPYGSSPPSGYGTPPAAPYGYQAPRKTNGMAIAAMVVSLASLLTCPIVGVVGIILGNRARNEIRSTGEDGDGMALAGIIVGWIAIGLTVLYVCLFAGMFSLPFLFP